MEKIRGFKLTSDLGGVARLQVRYGGNDGVNENGNLIKFEEKTWEKTGNNDILCGQSDTVDFTQTVIPNGAYVRLIAFVVAGKDCISNMFEYSKDSTEIKKLTIKGTTLINSLKDTK